MQEFELKINGQSVFILNGRLIRTVDTAADGFTAQILCDPVTQPDLYEAIKPYKYSPCTVSLNGELRLTGAITSTEAVRSGNSIVYNLEGFSNTFDFIDSVLIPPYEFNKMTLHQIASLVAQQTATQVEFLVPPGGIFDKATASSGQTGFSFLAPLAKQRSQLMSSTAQGNLIFQQANTSGQPVATIEEGSPGSLIAKTFQIKFDGRKRFKTYKVTSNTPFGFTEAVSVDNNIPRPRNMLKTANEITAGEMQKTADWQKNIALIESLTIQLPVIGWDFVENTLVTVKSSTMFIPDGFTFFIRQVEYTYDDSGKSSVLSLVPPNLYTEQEIVEPWFL